MLDPKDPPSITARHETATLAIRTLCVVGGAVLGWDGIAYIRPPTTLPSDWLGVWALLDTVLGASAGWLVSDVFLLLLDLCVRLVVAWIGWLERGGRS